MVARHALLRPEPLRLAQRHLDREQQVAPLDRAVVLIVHGQQPGMGTLREQVDGVADDDATDADGEGEPVPRPAPDGLPARRPPCRTGSIWTHGNHCHEYGIREIMVLPHGHGVGTARAVQMFRTYGEDAVEVRLHRTGIAPGERLHRELHRAAARRVPEWRDLLHSEKGPGSDRSWLRDYNAVRPNGSGCCFHQERGRGCKDGTSRRRSGRARPRGCEDEARTARISRPVGRRRGQRSFNAAMIMAA